MSSISSFSTAIKVLSGAALLSLSQAVGAFAQEVTWNIGYVNAAGSNYVDLIKTVPERIAKATDGRVKIELYDSLVAGPEQPSAVRDGRLDGSFALIVWLSAESPYLNVSLLPKLIESVPDFRKLLDPLLRDEFAKYWDAKYNARQIAIGAFEDQVILSRAPITKASDFAGKKVRVSNTGQASMMQALGASPTPVPFGEIVPALQRGVVDVVMTSLGPANGMGFDTVVKDFGTWHITPVQPWSLIINKQSWEALPADLKPIVEKEFRAIEDFDFDRFDAFNKELTDRLVGKGMSHFVAPDAELENVFTQGNLDASFETWYGLNEKAGTDGRALVEKIRALQK